MVNIAAVLSEWHLVACSMRVSLAFDLGRSAGDRQQNTLRCFAQQKVLQQPAFKAALLCCHGCSDAAARGESHYLGAQTLSMS